MVQDDKRPLILITNDDGISALGIHFLADLVSELGDVVVVAPDGPNSGGSASISVEKPLQIKQHEAAGNVKWYSINGTPVDCVKLGVHAVTPRMPDIILSGINHGSNTGNSVVNSGTMGAAIEGALKGIPSVGYSLVSHRVCEADFLACRDYVVKITKTVLEKGLPDDVCLNVNMPVGGNIKGMAMAKSCRGRWTGEYDEYNGPDSKKYYVLTGTYNNLEPDNEFTDLSRIADGLISIVPVCAYRDYEGAALPTFE